ncbi:MAG: glycosyltransferase [Planctomycetaceae bacterium]
MNTNPKVAIICWELGNLSETFVQQHVDKLPLPTMVVEWNKLSGPPYQPVVQSRLRWPGPSRRQQLSRESVLETFLKENEIEAVLAETGILARLLSDCCRKLAVPLLTHFHGIDAYAPRHTGNHGEDYENLFRTSAANIAVSQHMVDQLIRLGAPADRVHYASYYVDPELFGQTNPGNCDPHFLSVGRFVEKKAPLLTAMAFEHVVRRIPEARLRMIGDGPLLHAVRQFVRAVGIEASVDFLGAQPHSFVAECMQRARCFVQHSVVASDNDHEGTPVGIIEAQMSGLPVVSTRHAGICDVVIEGCTGYLVDEFDVAAMADAMLKLASDPSLAEQMGSASRENATSNYSFDKTLGRLAGILTDTVQRQHCSS